MIWSPDACSIQDLIVILGEKVFLLLEKEKRKKEKREKKKRGFLAYGSVW